MPGARLLQIFSLLFGFKIREQSSTNVVTLSSGPHKHTKLVCQLPEAAVTHPVASHSRSMFCQFWWDCAASGGFFQLLVAAWPHQSRLCVGLQVTVSCL